VYITVRDVRIELGDTGLEVERDGVIYIVRWVPPPPATPCANATDDTATG